MITPTKESGTSLQWRSPPLSADTLQCTLPLVPSWTLVKAYFWIQNHLQYKTLGDLLSV